MEAISSCILIYWLSWDIIKLIFKIRLRKNWNRRRKCFGTLIYTKSNFLIGFWKVSILLKCRLFVFFMHCMFKMLKNHDFVTYSCFNLVTRWFRRTIYIPCMYLVYIAALARETVRTGTTYCTTKIMTVFTPDNMDSEVF